MLPYWLLLAVLSLGSLAFSQRRQLGTIGDGPLQHRSRDDVLLILALVAITLMIGFRYHVGGDWVPYAQTYKSITARPFDLALHRSVDEIAYTILNWVAGKIGGGLWLVNLVCAIPFVVGLAAISRQQPNPWLALVVAAPLFVIVVGMGYTRQAVAAGFMLIGVAGLIRGRSFLWFVGWTLIGSAFHTSALIFIPVVAAIVFRATFLSVLLVMAAGLFAYYVILPAALSRYTVGYIHSVYEAKGAIFRIVPNAMAGLTLLAFPRQLTRSAVELKIWRGWAWLSLAALALFFVIKSTTIVDRISLYILPLQIFVLARIPSAFSHGRKPSLALTAVVIAYSALVLFLWLNLANHARFWVPYRLYPIS